MTLRAAVNSSSGSWYRRSRSSSSDIPTYYDVPRATCHVRRASLLHREGGDDGVVIGRFGAEERPRVDGFDRHELEAGIDLVEDIVDARRLVGDAIHAPSGLAGPEPF